MKAKPILNSVNNTVHMCPLLLLFKLKDKLYCSSFSQYSITNSNKRLNSLVSDCHYFLCSQRYLQQLLINHNWRQEFLFLAGTCTGNTNWRKQWSVSQLSGFVKSLTGIFHFISTKHSPEKKSPNVGLKKKLSNGTQKQLNLSSFISASESRNYLTQAANTTRDHQNDASAHLSLKRWSFFVKDKTDTKTGLAAGWKDPKWRLFSANLIWQCILGDLKWNWGMTLTLGLTCISKKKLKRWRRSSSALTAIDLCLGFLLALSLLEKRV